MKNNDENDALIHDLAILIINLIYATPCLDLKNDLKHLLLEINHRNFDIVNYYIVYIKKQYKITIDQCQKLNKIDSLVTSILSD